MATDNENFSPYMMDVIDGKTALSYLDGDEELLKEIHALFIVDAPKQIQNLKTAISRSEWKLALRLSHTLKGMASQIGAHNMQQAALITERAVKTKSHTEIRDSVIKLEIELHRALQALPATVGIDEGEE